MAVNRLGNVAHPPRAGEVALFVGFGCTKMLRFRTVPRSDREGEGGGGGGGGETGE